MNGLDVLGIHGNVGQGGGFTDGHAWVSHMVPDGRVTNYGLWPDSHPVVEDNGPGSDVRVGMEDGVQSEYSRYYDLRAEQVLKLKNYIARHDEWGYTHTCADWASDAVREVVGEDVDADDWLGLETPRELGGSITILESKTPTTPFNPLSDLPK